MADFQLILRSEPSDTPVDVRLRKLLKEARRKHGFKCVLVEQIETDAGRTRAAPAPVARERGPPSE
jgi:hypothetical protein